MRTKNLILEKKLNFLAEITEEELFNHFFIRHQSTMIKMCNKILECSKDKEVIKFASDILNVIDPDWFKGSEAVNSTKNKTRKNK